MRVDVRDAVALMGLAAMAVGGWFVSPGVGVALVGAALYAFAVWRMR